MGQRACIVSIVLSTCTTYIGKDRQQLKVRVVNEGALYSGRSKLSLAFYLRARSIRGRGVFEEIRYVNGMKLQNEKKIS